ncbi:MAG: VanZ family protein [Halioglobus sp.]|nr:VanZ family protein [Halioglobus sp.]
MIERYRKLIFGGYTALVAFASLLPAGGALVGSYDKSAHLLIYAIFATLAYRLRLSRRHYIGVCIGIIAYSGLLEVGQSFVPGREMSALDLLANTLGVSLGVLVCRVATRRSRASVPQGR